MIKKITVNKGIVKKIIVNDECVELLKYKRHAIGIFGIKIKYRDSVFDKKIELYNIIDSYCIKGRILRKTILSKYPDGSFDVSITIDGSRSDMTKAEIRDKILDTII